ncbi:hypothetical protein DMUE_2668 [Dictyocoela muelleri]|nr:hypothetical protein DMUE_2668 [Dictyocoela muelleri]
MKFTNIKAFSLRDKLCSDIYGPFSLEDYKHDRESEKYKGYFLTITDVYSRFSRVIFAYSITGDLLIKEIVKRAMRFGMPRVYISYNGKPYISILLHSFLFKNKIRPV